MANSLQEQLIKAGLADQAQIAREKPKAKRPTPSTASARKKPSRAKSPPRKASAKRIRDPELEREQRELRAMERERKKQEQQALQQARAIQQRKDKVRGLLLKHQCNDATGEIPFHFQANNRIRRLYVTATQRDALLAGSLLIVVMGKRDFLIDANLRAQVAEIDPDLYLFDGSQQQPETALAEDDPYKDYVVPDDLMW